MVRDPAWPRNLEEGSQERRAGVGNKAPCARRTAGRSRIQPRAGLPHLVSACRGDPVSPTASHRAAPPKWEVVVSPPQRNATLEPGSRQLPAVPEQTLGSGRENSGEAGNASSRARGERGPGRLRGGFATSRRPGPRPPNPSEPLTHARCLLRPSPPPRCPLRPSGLPRSPSSPGLTAQQRQQQDAEQRQPAGAARGSARGSHRGGLGEGSARAHGGLAVSDPRRAQEAERTGARAQLQQPQPEPEPEPEPEASRARAARAPYLRVLTRRRRRQAPPRDAPSSPGRRAAPRPLDAPSPPWWGGARSWGRGLEMESGWCGGGPGECGDLSEVGERMLRLPPRVQGLGT